MTDHGRYPDDGWALRCEATPERRRYFRVMMGDVALFAMDVQRALDVVMIRDAWGEETFLATHVPMPDAPGGWVHKNVKYWHPDTDEYWPMGETTA